MLYKPEAVEIAVKFSLESVLGPAKADAEWTKLRSQVGRLIAPLASHDVEPDEPQPLYDWSERVADRFSSTLTPVQLSILECIKDRANKATLDQIVENLSNDLDETCSGKTVAGALSGLSRKCKKFDIPDVYEARQMPDDTWIYSITKEAMPFVKILLGELSA